MRRSVGGRVRLRAAARFMRRVGRSMRLRGIYDGVGRGGEDPVASGAGRTPTSAVRARAPVFARFGRRSVRRRGMVLVRKGGKNEKRPR